MGSWDVTCSLTGVPIKFGDPCVLVVLRENFDPFKYLGWDAEYDIKTVIKGCYDDYGRINPTDGTTLEEAAKFTDFDSPTAHYHFFVNQTAWELAIKQYPMKQPDAEIEVAKLLNDVNNLFVRPSWVYEMKSVIIAFRLANRNPLAGYMATSQCYSDTVIHLFKHHKMIEECLVNLLANHPDMAYWMIGEDNELEQISTDEARQILDKVKQSI